MAALKDIGTAVKLVSKLDMGKISKLSEKVNLDDLIKTVTSMSESDLKMFMKMAKKGAGKEKKALPEINGDFYNLSSTLTPKQNAIRLEIRA
ncbi:MAG: acyl-CoA dehydrogenase family protein, partial [Trueperaceae bacterium]